MIDVWLLDYQRPCLGPSTAGGAVGTLIGNCRVNWSSSKSTFRGWSGIKSQVKLLTHPSPLEERAWFLFLFFLLLLLSHLSVSISRVNWSDYRSKNFYLFLLFSKVPPVASTWMVPVSTCMWELSMGIQTSDLEYPLASSNAAWRCDTPVKILELSTAPEILSVCWSEHLEQVDIFAGPQSNHLYQGPGRWHQPICSSH